MATDAFFVAFRLPNLLRRMFAEGGVFAGVRAHPVGNTRTARPPQETRELVDCVASVLSLALVVVTALGIALAPLIVYLSAPGFAAEPGKFDLTVEMLRVTFPYLFFISLVAFSAGILNTHNRFAVPAFTPVLLNVSLIVGAAFCAPYFDPPVKGAGVGGVRWRGAAARPSGAFPRADRPPAALGAGLRRISATPVSAGSSS